MLCLLYGSDPERFKEVVDRLGMPEDRRQRCVRDYPARDAAWTRLLTPHLVPATGAPATRGRMTVEYLKPANPGSELMERSLRQIGVFEVLAEAVNMLFVLPNDIRVINRECGFPNAYWSPNERTITLCYEWLAFVGMLLGGGAGQGTAQPAPQTAPDAPTAVDPAAQYFAAENRVAVGPLTIAALRARVQARQTAAADLVWKAGTPNWVRADQLAELRDLFAPAN
jgi:hypothetical protein